MHKLLLQGLVLPPLTEPAPAPDRSGARGAGRRRRCGGARAGSAARLSIREVDAGSCNGCELEIHALNNAFYDLERFGLRFVASPRHADVLLVTGPVTKQHARGAGAHLGARRRTRNGWWRSAIARVDGGIFAGSYACVGGVSAVVPVDLHIRGCPPSPTQLLKGLLALLQA